MNCKITKVRRKYNDYTITFKGMTQGAILALYNALVAHTKAGSVVGADVLAFLEGAIRASEDQTIIKTITDATNVVETIVSKVCTDSSI